MTESNDDSDIEWAIENWLGRTDLEFETEADREDAIDKIAEAIRENAKYE